MDLLRATRIATLALAISLAGCAIGDAVVTPDAGGGRGGAALATGGTGGLTGTGGAATGGQSQGTGGNPTGGAPGSGGIIAGTGGDAAAGGSGGTTPATGGAPQSTGGAGGSAIGTGGSSGAVGSGGTAGWAAGTNGSTGSAGVGGMATGGAGGSAALSCSDPSFYVCKNGVCTITVTCRERDPATGLDQPCASDLCHVSASDGSGLSDNRRQCSCYIVATAKGSTLPVTYWCQPGDSC